MTRLGSTILCCAVVSLTGCGTAIIGIERESMLTCPKGTVITTPGGFSVTNAAAGVYYREDIVRLALDAKMKRR